MPTEKGYSHTYRWHNQPQTNNQTPIINLSILQASHQLMENINSLSYYKSFHLLRKSRTVNWPLVGTETSSTDHRLHTVTIHSQGKDRNWKVLLRLTKLQNLNWTKSLSPSFLESFPLALFPLNFPSCLSSHTSDTLLSQHLHLFSLLGIPFWDILLASLSPLNLAQTPP